MSHVSKKQNMNRKILKVRFLGVFCRKINKKPIFKPEYAKKQKPIFAAKKQKPIFAPILYVCSGPPFLAHL